MAIVENGLASAGSPLDSETRDVIIPLSPVGAGAVGLVAPFQDPKRDRTIGPATAHTTDLKPDTDFAPYDNDTDKVSDAAATGDLFDRLRRSGAAGSQLPLGQRTPYRQWSRRYLELIAGLDSVIGLLAVVLGAFISTTFNLSGLVQALFTVAAGAAVWPLALASARAYDRSKIGVGGEEVRAVLRAAVVVVAAGAFPAGLLGTYGIVSLVAIAAPLAALASILLRIAVRKRLHHRQLHGHDLRSVIVVGSAYAAADLCSVLAREPHLGMRVIGVCVPQSEFAKARENGLTVIGDLEQVTDLTQTLGADAVAVTAGDATRHNYLRELSWALEGAEVELLVHPGLVEVAGPRMHIRPYVGLPLLHIEQPHFTGWRRFVKRGTDIVLTSIGLLAISPILLVIAAAIKLNDGGPVVFRQHRVGLDGSTFTMLKFRTMHTDAEARLADLVAQNPSLGLMFKLQNDPRITRVGRFLRKYSLDELPQLFNVLSGSMSLVGPRPPLQSEVDVYEDHARRRLLVTPGLTGLWQVSGRSLLSWEETVRLDLRYVENWTLTFDLHILWKTFFAVAAKRGAF